MTPKQLRILLITLPFVLAVWPMREGLFSGRMVGAGPDVNTTLWTMWWFQQEWLDAAWGGHSALFNFPLGGRGAILSPITATTWALLEPLIGPASAGAWTTWSQVALFGAAMVWLAREVGLSWAASYVVLMACFCQRYLLYAPGETSVVGITALPIPIGLIALMRIRRGSPQLRWFWLAVLCMALQPLENPYLTPVLPGVALLMIPNGWPSWSAFRNKRRTDWSSLIKPGQGRLFLTLLAGFVGIVLTAMLHQGVTTSAYESANVLGFVELGSHQWAVVEETWARAKPQWLFWPPETMWSESAGESKFAQGREYLGLSVLVLSIIGAFSFQKKCLPWIGFGLIGIVLALGSDWWGGPGPFALLNGICIRLVRALTQPTRYLILSTIGLSLAAGWGFEAIRRKSYRASLFVGGAITLDAFLLGGLSLKLPSSEVPMPQPVVNLQLQDGGVLFWPWDGVERAIDPERCEKQLTDQKRKACLDRTRELEEAPSRSRLLQIVHGRPAATMGTGSWPLIGRAFPDARLRTRYAWVEGFKGGTANLDLTCMAIDGYRWIVADMNALKGSDHEKWLGDPDELFGPPHEADENYRIYELPDPPEDARGYCKR